MLCQEKIILSNEEISDYDQCMGQGSMGETIFPRFEILYNNSLKVGEKKTFDYNGSQG